MSDFKGATVYVALVIWPSSTEKSKATSMVSVLFEWKAFTGHTAHKNVQKCPKVWFTVGCHSWLSFMNWGTNQSKVQSKWQLGICRKTTRKKKNQQDQRHENYELTSYNSFCWMGFGQYLHEQVKSTSETKWLQTLYVTKIWLFWKTASNSQLFHQTAEQSFVATWLEIMQYNECHSVFHQTLPKNAKLCKIPRNSFKCTATGQILQFYEALYPILFHVD